MFNLIYKTLGVFLLGTSLVHAGLLPNPQNLNVTGDILTWDSVEGATGYNIYHDFSYFDTVKGSNNYELTRPGTYWVVAFDEDGNYGSQYGYDDVIEYAGSISNDVVSVSYYGTTSIVQTTCMNVEPGESCIASCSATASDPTVGVFSRYMSGGACSTSDIVEADALVSRLSYSCTVPTYSGEVVAQAICVHF